MKPAPLAIALLLLASASAGSAGNADAGCRLSSSCCDSPARFGARHDARDARIAIKTQGGDAVLLLTDEVVAVQLSDARLGEVRRKFRKEEDSDEDNLLAHTIKIAVMSSVSAILDHSAECPVRELRDVEYRNGRLVFLTEDGDRLFDHMDVNDEDVMSSFTERDAQAFVRKFRKVKAALAQ